MAKNTEKADRRLFEVLKETQAYLADVLSENDQLRQSLHSLRDDYRRMRMSNLGLEAQVITLATELTRSRDAARGPRLDWSEQT